MSKLVIMLLMIATQLIHARHAADTTINSSLHDHIVYVHPFTSVTSVTRSLN